MRYTNPAGAGRLPRRRPGYALPAPALPARAAVGWQSGGASESQPSRSRPAPVVPAVVAGLGGVLGGDAAAAKDRAPRFELPFKVLVHQDVTV